MKKIFTILCLLLLCSGAMVAQTRIGYSNGTFNRSDGLRFGSGEKQGMAVKLGKEKLRLLKGKKVVGVRAVFGTRNLTNLQFFLTTALGQQPLYEQPASGATTSWKDFAFDTPYVIGEEEVLYVGYTLEASASYRPLAFDRSGDMEGVSWIYSEDGTWTDTYGNSFGCGNLFLLVEDVDPFTDVCLKSLSVNGYYKAENAYRYSVQILNFGTQPVASFDVSCRIGENEPVVYSFTGQNIAANGTFDFDLPEYISHVSGDLPIKVSVANINGVPDADMNDNEVNSHIFIYPAFMEKRILLEGFTGQSCGQCPAGHRIIANVLENTQESVIEVFHHAGFEPDAFTMKEDGEYCWFYNGGTQFAPAVMVNRIFNPDLGEVGTATRISNVGLESSIARAAAVQPYVSVDIDRNFDEDTRELKAVVKVHPYVMPEAGEMTLNVFIVQDSVIAGQSSGSSNYAHRYAFRGSLTGTWGLSVALEAGKDYTREFTYTLPDAIRSTYENKSSLPTELEHMYLVAFVSQYTNKPDGCNIYNSNMVKFSRANGETGISETPSEVAPVRAYVDGNRISISGDFSRMDVFDMGGKQVGSWNSHVESFTLDEGFYILRAVCGGGVVSQKIAVMK